ncbi:MAG: methionine--tRNA ligase [Pseudomonadota bacterium]
MKHYLTTPIYYASGAPHLGHAYTTILADTYKRFWALCGDEVRLVSGTDEHGQKIERTAAAAGVPVTDFVADRSKEFARLWHELGLDIDRFERTTSKLHRGVALAIWRRLVSAGDIYRGNYEGLYCVECEQYFTEGDTCPVHRRALEFSAEPAWFFRLSRYQQALLDYIERHPDFISPRVRANEVLSFLRENALRDLAVSRASTSWGIPVPGDSSSVLYVWIDALASYLSALLEEDTTDLDAPSVQAWWQNTRHFIGKDILTFHAIYWPALLWSAGLPLPRQIVVNGWLTVEGKKISKSDPATIVDPRTLLPLVGRDGLRLYFLRAVTLGQDVDFSRQRLIELVNSDLANNLGNLHARFATLAIRHFGGRLHCTGPLETSDSELLAVVQAAANEVSDAFQTNAPATGARAFVLACSAVNTWFQQQAPWQQENQARRPVVLWVTSQALADLSVPGLVFVPELAGELRRRLGLPEAALWVDIGKRRETLLVHDGPPLYPRVRG